MVEEADRQLAKLGRCEAQLRLRIGELLDALHRKHGHHELGFSSIDAYVVERCRRSRRWGRATRGLARRIRERGLVAIGRAIREGHLGFCMAELLVRHASPDDERALIHEATRSTVRQMQAKLTGVEAAARVEEPIATTSVHAVSAEELLMVSASRMLVGYLSGGRASDEMLVNALLGEAETTLQSLAGARVEAIVLPQVDAANIEAGLRAMREARTKEEREDEVAVAPRVAPMDASPLPKSARALDREIVRCCRELDRRNLELGALARALFAGRLWQRLGYRSAAQYARERVGVSLSSLEHRATLARRIERSPALGEALERGEIGYEAALLIGRVLGSSSSAALVQAWIDRAKVRTYKHLREEVDAVLLGAGLDPRVERRPPSAADLEAVAELERRVQSGDVFRSLLGARPGPQMSVTFIPRAGSIRPLRLTLPIEVHHHWQRIEAEFHAVAGWRASFVAFACFSLWSTWLPYLEARDDKWIDVYRRDRHRCTSPVCERRDVTPHHVVFQSHGGTHDPANVVAACSWCHLHGIHRGRLAVQGDARYAQWTIGSDAGMEVRGREMRAAG